jgi:hypothetical protein
VTAFIIIVRGKKNQSGSTEVPRFAPNPNAVDRSHHVPAKAGSGVSGEESEAAEILRLIGLITLFRAMITLSPTNLAKAGTKLWVR